MGVGEHLRRLRAYALIPMLGALSPILAIPVITHSHGAAGWTAIAIGQSVGSAAAVLIELAWGLLGPQKVAAASDSERWRLYRTAFASRSIVYLIAGPIAASVAIFISKEYALSTAFSALATAAIGLSPGWYMLGVGTPRKILYIETIPRIASVAASCIILLMGGALWWNPLLLLVSSVFAPIFVRLTQAPAGPHIPLGAKEIGQSVLNQKVGLAGRVISAIYISLPVAIVGAVAPPVVTAFAAADRLMRLSLVFLQAIPNSFQNWLGQATEGNRRRRVRDTLAINLLLGVCAGAGFAVTAPVAAKYLFSGEIDLPIRSAAICGVIIAVVCLTRAAGGLVLVHLSRIGAVALSALAGGAVGALAIPPLTIIGGADGALFGILIAEIVVLLIQIGVIMRSMNLGSYLKDRLASRRVVHA